MDLAAWTVFFSLLLAGNLDQQRINEAYEQVNTVTPAVAPLGTLSLIGIGVAVLTVGTGVLVAYGAYNLWGRIMATSDAFGFSPSAPPEMPVITAPAPEPVPEATPTPPVVEEPPPAPEPGSVITSPPVPATPEATPDDAPPPVEEPVSGGISP